MTGDSADTLRNEVSHEEPRTMSNDARLNQPWLVAVWPGMGHVALAAGYYLMAKLGMSLLAEFPAGELFDVDNVEVKEGLIQSARLPRNRFFVWNDPDQKRDLVIFIGEAQPPLGKFAFCQKLIEFAQDLGVQKLFTFAAMGTLMRPHRPSRVFGAATDADSLAYLKGFDLTFLEDGQIGGLNGVLLGAAAQAGLGGACLLGEMPQVFAPVPFPKASLAVLKVFSAMTGITIDMAELSEQATVIEQHLTQLLERLEEQSGQKSLPEEEPYKASASDEGPLASEDENRIAKLFEQAQNDRSRAYELKNELDRLGVFKDYEDRFLDLFRKAK